MNCARSLYRKSYSKVKFSNRHKFHGNLFLPFLPFCVSDRMFLSWVLLAFCGIAVIVFFILRLEDTLSHKNRCDDNLRRREKECYDLKNRYIFVSSLDTVAFLNFNLHVLQGKKFQRCKVRVGARKSLHLYSETRIGM